MNLDPTSTRGNPRWQFRKWSGDDSPVFLSQNYHASPAAVPIPLPRRLTRRRLYFGLALQWVQSATLYSRLEFSLEGAPVLTIPVALFPTFYGASLSPLEYEVCLPQWNVRLENFDSYGGETMHNSSVVETALVPNGVRTVFATFAGIPLTQTRVIMDMVPTELDLEADALRFSFDDVIAGTGTGEGSQGFLGIAYGCVSQ